MTDEESDNRFVLGAIIRNSTTVLRAAAISAATALLLSGCATITSGGTDHVKIDSKPHGQPFEVYQGGSSVARGITPQTIAVERTSSGLLVICGGSREYVDSGFNGWTLGNLLLAPPVGTAIGWIIDGISGAVHGYDDVTVSVSRDG